MEDNIKKLVDEYMQSEYLRGRHEAQIEMLVDILFMKAEQKGKKKYGDSIDDLTIDGNTILAIFQRKYPQEIIDLFKED